MSESRTEVDAGAPGDDAGTAWEREVLTRLAFAAIKEQRSARRWGIFFKLAAMAYLILLLVLYLPFEWGDLGSGERHTALIDIEGTISATSGASADRIASGLRNAFEDPDTAAVILRINSPGGSPVQAGYVNTEIQRLRKKHPDIPVYAVIQDMCASGGYYIAAAAEKIYADKASVVGSIGVIMSSFGFVGTMDKLGVERRLLTAGENKAVLDPFSPIRPSDVRHMTGLLNTIHAQFIEVVRKGRGERLANDPRVFSGLYWTGEEALELGLVDALASAGEVARDVVGEENIVDFTAQPRLSERLLQGLGIAIGRTLGSTGEAPGRIQLR
jgi:protease-4